MAVCALLFDWEWLLLLPFSSVFAVSSASTLQHTLFLTNYLSVCLCCVIERGGWGRRRVCAGVRLSTYAFLCVRMQGYVCVCPRLILPPLFPLRISCIIYELLMNMLISWRAGRGERASPVLFLHSSDERGKKRGIKKGENKRERRFCGGEGFSGKEGRAEKEKDWKERMWKYIY